MSNYTLGFRTALNGFHKGDVAGYIEKINSQHHSEIQKCQELICSLQDENRALKQQLNLMMMSMPLAEESPPAPAPEAAPSPAQKPEPVSAPAETQDLMHLELLAYRRAEAVEYNAKQRARKLYQQMGILCDDALDQFQTADIAVKQAAQEILSQIDTLEQSYHKISDALRITKEQLTTVSNLQAIEPED